MTSPSGFSSGGISSSGLGGCLGTTLGGLRFGGEFGEGLVDGAAGLHLDALGHGRRGVVGRRRYVLAAQRRLHQQPRAEEKQHRPRTGEANSHGGRVSTRKSGRREGEGVASFGRAPPRPAITAGANLYRPSRAAVQGNEGGESFRGVGAVRPALARFIGLPRVGPCLGTGRTGRRREYLNSRTHPAMRGPAFPIPLLPTISLYSPDFGCDHRFGRGRARSARPSARTHRRFPTSTLLQGGISMIERILPRYAYSST